MGKRSFPNIESPLNAQERLLYACAIRLDALCDMVSSLVEVIAQEKGLATTSNKIETKTATNKAVESTPVKKEVAKVEEKVVEAVEEKPKTTRRTTKRK